MNKLTTTIEGLRLASEGRMTKRLEIKGVGIKADTGEGRDILDNPPTETESLNHPEQGMDAFVFGLHSPFDSTNRWIQF